jgi:hypothetical protein
MEQVAQQKTEIVAYGVVLEDFLTAEGWQAVRGKFPYYPRVVEWVRGPRTITMTCPTDAEEYCADFCVSLHDEGPGQFTWQTDYQMNEGEEFRFFWRSSETPKERIEWYPGFEEWERAVHGWIRGDAGEAR